MTSGEKLKRDTEHLKNEIKKANQEDDEIISVMRMWLYKKEKRSRLLSLTGIFAIVLVAARLLWMTLMLLWK